MLLVQLAPMSFFIPCDNWKRSLFRAYFLRKFFVILSLSSAKMLKEVSILYYLHNPNTKVPK